MLQYTVTLTDDEEKALLWDMISVKDWSGNIISNKVRQCVDEICSLALEDKTYTILTLVETQQLRDALDAQGIVLTSVKQLPLNIKMQIVALARVKSAAERQAEFEVSLP